MTSDAPRATVRRLTVADAQTYRELRLRALREHPLAFTSDTESEQVRPLAWSQERLSSNDGAFWGAFHAGDLLGMVGLERARRPKERHKGTVVGMYVAPEVAGRGAGAALMDALLLHAQGQGMTCLVLTVTEGNGVAQRVYERAGFKAFGIEPRAIRVDGRYHGKIHMVLEL